MNKPKLIDPRKLYKTRKFKEQEQDTPALQDDMIPEPDCGENSYTGNEKLLNRNALITGGDSGIGRAAAIAYAREGANVAIQFFPGEEKDANEVKELIEKEGRKALLLPVDLRDDDVATEIVEKTIKEFGQLDILVLNAAQQIANESLQELPIRQVEDSFKVNVINMFETVKAAEKHLPVGSTIVITTSVQAYDPSPSLIDYAATKAATKSLILSLAKHFAPKGIRVNGVAPGPIWTPLQLDKGQPKGKIPEFGIHSLLERAGQPAELAHIYVYLASNDSSYVTSQVYGITGGEAID